MASSEAAKDTPEAAPMSAQSLYSALGLSPEDVEALAKIPENEITVETLPYLIMDLKAKRAAKDADVPVSNDEERDTELEQEFSEKTEDHPESPSTFSSAQILGQEREGREDDECKAEHPSTKDKKEERSGKASKEKPSKEGAASDEELDDKPTVFPHICTICKIKSNGIKVGCTHTHTSFTATFTND